jgi:Bacterial membrane protein YfhO
MTQPSAAQIPLASIIGTRSFLIASLGYLALSLVLFWPLFKGYCLTSNAAISVEPPFEIPGKIDAVPYVNLWTGDFIQQFSQFQEYQYRAAKDWRFPTWNPRIYMGQPFHANGQSAMLFPPNWIYFLVNPDRVRGPVTVLRLWISAAAIFCLLRKFSLAPTPAFVGGAIWTFSSFNMHWLMWPHSNASLWAPVVLLAVDYLLVHPSWRNYAISSLAATPLFLAGHPGTIYLCVCLTGGYSLIRLVDLFFQGSSIRQLLIALLVCALAMFTAVLASSAALLPLLIQIRHSFEYLDTSGVRSAVDDIPWKSLWLFLMPEYFGRPRGLYPGFDYDGPDNYVEMSMWFGAIAFVLAITFIITTALARFGHFTGKKREPHSFLVIFGMIAFILSLMIGFKIWPIFNLVAASPGAQLTNIRRFFMITNFAGAVLCACALQQILVNRGRIAAMLCSIIAVEMCYFVIDDISAEWDDLQRRWQTSLKLMPKVWDPNWRQLIHSMAQEFVSYRMVAGAILLILGTIILLWILLLIYKRRQIPPMLRYGLAAIISLDVLLPAYNWNPVAPLDLSTPSTPAILQTLIQQTGDGRTVATDMMLAPNINMDYGYNDVRGYDFPHDQRQVTLFEKLGLSKHDNRSVITLDRIDPHIETDLATYFDRTCVRSLLAEWHARGDAGKVTELKLDRDHQSPGFMNWPRIAGPVNEVSLFSNPNSYPRTFFAQTAFHASSPQQAMAALLDSSVDLRDRSVFESPRASPPPVATHLAPGDACRIIQDKPEQIVIDSQSASPRMLVLEDRMDDGWKVSIDDKPAEALTANYLFRGVFVPAGHHTVEWTYQAPGLFAGFVISATTILGLVCLLIATGIRRHAANSTP